ncbi:MAG: Crp/Fnr family transcriptional regulator [Bacteroidetes bacterium]|nr:Crp/Fnr family transcriptional regulator [Bacteroidota bacterium]
MGLLDLLTEEDRKIFSRTQKEKNILKNELLFSEGNSPSGVHVLIKGKVKLFTTDVQGREQIIHLARPGDIMGYRAVLGNDSYSCSASALEDSLVTIIPRETFFLLLEQNAAFSHSIIKLLTAELRHAEHHLAGMARKPVKARLADAVLHLAETYGYEEDGSTLPVSLTREEIAGLVGTATETTIRILKSMEEEGLLATSGRKIRLLDVTALRRCARNA